MDAGRGPEPEPLRIKLHTSLDPLQLGEFQDDQAWMSDRLSPLRFKVPPRFRWDYLRSVHDVLGTWLMIGPRGDSLIFASHTTEEIEGIQYSLIHVDQILIAESQTRPGRSFKIPVTPRAKGMRIPLVHHMEIVPPINALVILFRPDSVTTNIIKQSYSLDTQQLISTTVIRIPDPDPTIDRFLRVARTGAIVSIVTPVGTLNPNDIWLSDQGWTTIVPRSLQAHRTAFRLVDPKRIKSIQAYPNDFWNDPLTLYIPNSPPGMQLNENRLFSLRTDSYRFIGLFFIDRQRYIAVDMPNSGGAGTVALEIELAQRRSGDVEISCAYDATHGRLWVCFDDDAYALELEGARREAYHWHGYTPAGATPAIVREAAMLAALRSVLRPDVPDEMLLHIFSYL